MRSSVRPPVEQDLNGADRAARVPLGLLVVIGGFLGAVLRYGISLMMPWEATAGFPWSTWIVNMVGSGFLSWLYAWLHMRPDVAPVWKSLLGTGVAGAFTTFSTFSMESVLLVEQGLVDIALLYVAASLLGGLLCAWIGFLCGSRRTSRSTSKNKGETR
ncbi:fluoride efflux transporter CrcB [Paenibacillus sp. 481]|uniref:fluoride efflux transporter CrcB n=1 Tax=Paenibacillus sp. 481 TaxID=2835869 RepID=UPI001E4D23F8|nr:fluoride efflux transporter CrcB [Paenibacillus sp. 481]UHA74314.1 fluoride efflux transporter CrcB [Paenibacillus sp. 481]